MFTVNPILDSVVAKNRFVSIGSLWRIYFLTVIMSFTYLHEIPIEDIPICVLEYETYRQQCQQYGS